MNDCLPHVIHGSFIETVFIRNAQQVFEGKNYSFFQIIFFSSDAYFTVFTAIIGQQFLPPQFFNNRRD